MNPDILAKKLWDYHHMNQKLMKADVLLCLTSNDLRVAEYTAKLYHDGWAPKILFSGNRAAREDDLRKTTWGMPEAEKFKEIACALGVPEGSILVEPTALNTGEAVRFAYALLEKENRVPRSVILIEKPFMERRAWAIFKKQWPDASTQAVVTSPPISYENYPTREIPKDQLINVMVGDFQRVVEYPNVGYQIEQEIPDEARLAYEELLSLGYTKGLIAPVDP